MTQTSRHVADADPMLRPGAGALLVELVGSAVLTMTVIAAAVGARTVAGRDGAQEWVVGSLAAGAVLAALMLALPGGRFHPLVTFIDLVGDRLSVPDAAARIVAQLLGGLVGSVFGLWSFYVVRGIDLNLAGIEGYRVRDVLVNGALGGALLGLVVGAVAVRRRHDLQAAAVALATVAVGLGVDHVTWANPAIALGRIVDLTGLAPVSVPLVWVGVTVVGQVAGVAVALVVLRVAEIGRTPAED